MNVCYFMFYLMIRKRKKKKPATKILHQQSDTSNHHVSNTFLAVCSESVSRDRQSCPVILGAQGVLAVNTAHLVF